ncbi:hypothetical protein Tco_0662066 [Tanacetum coccineum]
MGNSKRGSIPMQEKLKLSKSQGASTPAELKRMQNVPYALAMGSIIYVTAVKNILKYLRNTKDMFLVYEDADDLKSQTGYVFVLNGGAVDWKSTKQIIFATSSVEAEYIAAIDAFKEAVWVRKFISSLGARHYLAKVYYLREVIESGNVKIEKVHIDNNLADPFTKALPFPMPSEHTKTIGMLLASSLM